MVSVESACAWIPFILETLDYELEEDAPECLAELELRRSEYLKRQMYATTWFERKHLRYLVDAVAEDRVLWETDFPHPTCIFPAPLKIALDHMSDLTETRQRKVLSDSTVKLNWLKESLDDAPLRNRGQHLAAPRRLRGLGDRGLEVQQLRKEQRPAAEEPVAVLGVVLTALEPLAIAPGRVDEAGVGQQVRHRLGHGAGVVRV